MKIDTSARAETWRSLKMTGNLTNVARRSASLPVLAIRRCSQSG